MFATIGGCKHRWFVQAALSVTLTCKLPMITTYIGASKKEVDLSRKTQLRCTRTVPASRSLRRLYPGL
jgi:hypothetical protein